MIVKKTSLFPASQETVYEKIRRPETLRLVAAPYASTSTVRVPRATCCSPSAASTPVSRILGPAEKFPGSIVVHTFP